MSGEKIYRARDGFLGTVIGSYITREGEMGVVLQQIGTRVCHIYREQSVEIAGDDALGTLRKEESDISAAINDFVARQTEF
jgi:hypothetical protein